VIVKALQDAGVSAETVGYLEAHGTGTSLGDPIEVAGLKEAFGESTGRKQYCAIGSLKSNIGHLEPAAGIAGVIKALLSMKAKQLPPTLHFDEPNANIRFEESPFYVNDRLKPWASEGPRRAGVSSFGMGGVNAHVVLEEAPERSEIAVNGKRGLELLRMSGRNEQAVRELSQRWLGYLEEHKQAKMEEVCFSANTGRAEFRHRLAISAGDVEELSRKLGQVASGELAAVRQPSRRAKVAFLFTGQGTQRAGMGRELYESEAVFRQSLEHCDEVMREEGSEVGLLDVLFGKESARIDQTEWTQVSLFALEYSLFELLGSWGIHPDAVLGHSVGEYAAACAAGVFSLEQGLRLLRGRAWPQLDVAHQVQPGAPRVGLISNATGQYWSAGTPSAEYWARHPHEPGRFAEGLNTLLADGVRVFCELGPEPALCRLGQQTIDSADVHWLPTLQRGTPELRSLFDTVTSIYTQGVADVDWAALYRAYPQRRISLPTYPFLRQPHWFQPPSQHEPVEAVAPPPAPLLENGIDARSLVTLHGQEWVPEPLAAVIGTGAEPGAYLLFDNGSALARACEERMVRAGHRVLCVETGAAFERRAPDRLQLNPYEPGHVGQLIECLGAFNGLWAGVLDLWLSAWAPESSLAAPSVDARVASHLERLRAVSTALDRRSIRGGLGIVLLAGSHRGSHSWLPNPEAAALAALARTLCCESPRLRCRMVELPGDETPDEAPRVILDELRASDDVSEVRYQHGGRRVRRLRKLSALLPAPASLAPGKTILIVGGLGGVGQAMAESLATFSGITLILAGRTSVLVHKESRQLGTGATGSAARGPRAKALRSLQSHAAKVVYMTVDLSNPSAIAELYRRIREEHGKLDGIIHAAGVASPPSSARVKSKEAFAIVLAPKVLGSLALWEHAPKPLDFFVLVSSIASLNGELGRGLSDYAAANGFQNGLAGALRAQGFDFVSAQIWPEWLDTGLSATSGRAERGVPRLQRSLAQAAFLGCLSEPNRDYVVLPSGHEWTPRAPASSEPLAPNHDAVAAVQHTQDSFEHHRAILIGILERVLAVAPGQVDFAATFASLAIDSLILLDVVHALEQAYRAPIDPATLAEHDDVDSLSRYLAFRWPAAAVEVVALSVSAGRAGGDPASQPSAESPADATADLRQLIQQVGQGKVTPDRAEQLFQETSKRNGERT
jgi:malonyl CoA-acyl carrier protein transacylase